MQPVDGEPLGGPWQVESLSSVAGRLMSRMGRPEGRPALLAVDGRSGGGKSTVAARLASVVPASCVVSTDDIAWYHSFFDWLPLLVEGVLEPLRSGGSVSYRPPPWVVRDRRGAIEVPAGLDLVVVEGVGSSRTPVHHLYDASVWVQSDARDARERGIQRDVERGRDPQSAVAFWDEWDAEEEPRLRADRPWERAVLIVAGTPRIAHDSGSEVVVADGPLRPARLGHGQARA